MLSTRYSATFLNGQVTSEPNSGNPGKMSFFFLRLVLDFLVGDTYFKWQYIKWEGLLLLEIFITAQRIQP